MGHFMMIATKKESSVEKNTAGAGSGVYLDIKPHITKYELEQLQEKLRAHKREYERINQRFMYEERKKAYYE